MAELAALESALQASEQTLASLDLSLAATDKRASTRTDDVRSAKSYLSLGGRKTPEEIAVGFSQLIRVLDAFPPELRQLANSPFPKLQQLYATLKDRIKAGERVAWEEIVSLKQTISNTIATLVAQTKNEHQHQAHLAEQLDALLDNVLFYRHIAAANPALGEQKLALDSLQAQLVRLLDAADVKAGQLDLIERRLAAIRIDIDAKVVETAHKTALCESITRNLMDMGYEEMNAFADDEHAMATATMRIPGGERVKIAVHPNGQAAFEFQHERAEQTGPITRDEMALIRQQEGKWCKDAKQLVRKLVAEGFDYQMSLEKEIPDQAIKVVVVETAEDILAQSEDHLYEEKNVRYKS